MTTTSAQDVDSDRVSIADANDELATIAVDTVHGLLDDHARQHRAATAAVLHGVADRALMSVLDDLAAHDRECTTALADFMPASKPHGRIVEARWLIDEAVSAERRRATRIAGLAGANRHRLAAFYRLVDQRIALARSAADPSLADLVRTRLAAQADIIPMSDTQVGRLADILVGA